MGLTPLVVRAYVLEGNAVNGTDYADLNGIMTIKAGTTNASVQVKPRRDQRGACKLTVKLFLMLTPAYAVDGPAVGKVKIFVRK